MSTEQAKLEVVLLTTTLKIDGQVGSLAELNEAENMIKLTDVKVYDRKDNKPLFAADELLLNPDALSIAIPKDKITKEGVF